MCEKPAEHALCDMLWSHVVDWARQEWTKAHSGFNPSLTMIVCASPQEAVIKESNVALEFER